MMIPRARCDEREPVFPLEEPRLTNLRRMNTTKATDGVENPNFEGSSLTLDNIHFAMEATVADQQGGNAEPSTSNSSGASNASTATVTETTEKSGDNKEDTFHNSWDKLDSYLATRKAPNTRRVATAAMLMAQHKMDLEAYGASPKRRCCKVTRCMTTLLFAVVCLSMIAAIFGIVTAEIFVKRGYFTRPLRVKIQPPVPVNIEDYEYNYGNWTDDSLETTLGTDLPITYTLPITPPTNVTVTTTTVSTPATCTSTTTVMPATTVPLASRAAIDSTNDNDIPDIAKLLTIPGPLQRFPAINRNNFL